MESRTSLPSRPPISSFGSGSVGSALRFRSHLVRSSIRLPPELESITQSRGLTDAPPRAGNKPEAAYGLLTLLQFLSDNPSVPQRGLCIRSAFSVTGRGRTYEVRRYSDGRAEDIDDFNHWRPSIAHKHLVLPPSTGGGSAALAAAYRSLINELRILTHKPLSTHPNLLRITGVCWAMAADCETILPVICTEFATLGTLTTFVSAWECPYRFKRQLILDVAEGLAALHSCFIVHGDVKTDNVLVVVSEDTDSGCPFVAKLSDFGFSLDTARQRPGHTHGSLFGYTLLWAAPEATEVMPYSEMHLTDVYSLGFVIWTVAMNGRNLFEALDDLPQDPAQRLEAFRFLKETDDIDAAAVRSLLNKLHGADGLDPNTSSDLDLAELIELWRHTLRLRPRERAFGAVLDTLRPGCLRQGSSRAAPRPGSPLPPFDTDRIYLEISTLFAHRGLLNSRVRPDLQVAARAQTAGRTGLPPASPQMGDPTLPWRFPSKFSSRPAGATYALFCMYFFGHGHGHGHDAERPSAAEAGRWLRLSAESGHTLAMALCARLNKQLGIGLPAAVEHSWLMLSAQNGSRPAMAALRNKDARGYVESRDIYKTRFWGLCHGLSEQLISDLLAMGAKFASSHGRNPRSSLSDHGDNLLHCAALMGSEAIVRHLLDAHGADVNAVNSRGETAFLLACKSGHGAVVDLLLDRGADATICNAYGDNALHWLDSFEHDAIAHYAADFVRRGLDINKVSRLDDSFADPIARRYLHRLVGGTPLHRAVEVGNMLLVDALLRLGADACHGDRGLTPVCRALKNHNADMARQLFSRPMSKDINTTIPNVDGTAAFTFLSRPIIDKKDAVLLHYIHDAYSHDDATKDIMAWLVRRGAKLAGGSHDALYLAVSRMDSSAAEFLLSAGYGNLTSQITLDDQLTATPLALAVMKGDARMVRTLLHHGADPESSMMRFPGIEPEEFPALWLCVKDGCEANSLAVAAALIAAGANVNRAVQHDNRESPLSRALAQSHFDMSRLLIEHGAQVDHPPPTPPPSFKPPVTVLKLLSSTNILDRGLYRAYEFLLAHPGADLPLWTVVGWETVFHSIFKTKEIRRRNIDPDNLGAIFHMVRRRFPNLSTLAARDIQGWTPLHHAVFYANTVGVRLLLSAGCDPRDQIVRDRKRVRAAVRMLFHANLVEYTEADVREMHEHLDEDVVHSHEGRSALDMARDDIFDEIPPSVRDVPDEYDEFVERRRDIKSLLASWGLSQVGRSGCHSQPPE
ncbi:ankyrin repeat-containing domain protein [Lasiosphaeris hirsuta]|uniref:Ankyrin repeat-containing domain protein n=1 Tax=Lasiosphaeris hirsuta TaxID=260670 RepID=A0AA40AZV3_9PEZI|nr:ankyrin repeat-containing domain protein [Lasiosphaeris hirsuta]